MFSDEAPSNPCLRWVSKFQTWFPRRKLTIQMSAIASIWKRLLASLEMESPNLPIPPNHASNFDQSPSHFSLLWNFRICRTSRDQQIQEESLPSAWIRSNRPCFVSLKWIMSSTNSWSLEGDGKDLIFRIHGKEPCHPGCHCDLS